MIDLQILKHSCIPGINPTWSWWMIFYMYFQLGLLTFYLGFLVHYVIIFIHLKYFLISFVLSYIDPLIIYVCNLISIYMWISQIYVSHQLVISFHFGKKTYVLWLVIWNLLMPDFWPNIRLFWRLFHVHLRAMCILFF